MKQDASAPESTKAPKVKLTPLIETTAQPEFDPKKWATLTAEEKGKEMARLFVQNINATADKPA